jgi:hypothetical protein
MSAAGAVMTMKAQTSGGGFNPDYTLLQRLENAAFSYARYLGKALALAPGADVPASWNFAADMASGVGAADSDRHFDIRCAIA